jgi:hypothetical protein
MKFLNEIMYIKMISNFWDQWQKISIHKTKSMTSPILHWLIIAHSLLCGVTSLGKIFAILGYFLDAQVNLFFKK